MPIGIGTAGAIAGGISAGGSLLSGIFGSSAAKKAAKARAAALAAAEQSRLGMFEKARGYMEPYATLGTESLPTLKGLLGLGEGGAGDMTGLLEKYPGYQFALGEGQKAIGNQQQAAGARYSGNALTAASDYAQQMGYGVFSDYFNKVLGITDRGQAAAGGIANSYNQLGTDLANLKVGGGEAKAGGILGSAQAWQGAIGGITKGLGGILGSIAGPGGGYSGGGWSGTAKPILDNA